MVPGAPFPLAPPLAPLAAVGIVNQVCLLPAAATPALPPVRQAEYLTKTESHKIVSFDGVEIQAEARYPVGLAPTARQPLVVFCASWATPIFEYALPTDEWAKAGMFTIMYAVAPMSTLHPCGPTTPAHLRVMPCMRCQHHLFDILLLYILG